MKYAVGKTDGLIIVDVQRDFCPGGALPVPNGDRIIPVLNRYVELFRNSGGIFASRDWHPPDHISFRPKGPWPTHCVRGTPGADFHPDLNLPDEAVVISKASETDKEAYSAFEDTGLAEMLSRRGISRIFVGGLATDYCVKSTVLDGVSAGFTVVLLVDAIRGVDVSQGDSEKAICEMVRSGCECAVIADLTVGEQR